MKKAADIFSWQKVSFPNSRKLNLSGILYSGPEAEGTVVIVCHGFLGTKEGRGQAVLMAERISTLGLPTFLFDFTGSGESEGNFADISLTNHVDDLASALRFCGNRGFDKFVTVGRSFGGATVVAHAAFAPEVAGICAWATPAEVTKLFAVTREKYRGAEAEALIDLIVENIPVHIKFGFFHDLDHYQLTERIKLLAPRPLLIIHGDRDSVVPLKNARLLHEHAGEPKELAIISGGDHIMSGCHEEAWQILINWLHRYFAGKSCKYPEY
jgi:putative redox protein